MKTTRIISLCLALVTLLALVGCNQNTPEETTGSVITTEAPVLDVTEPEATEPEVTEPQFPEYAGPSSDFKFSLASVLPANDFASYTDFLASSEKSFLVPALAEKMVPQGMDIWEERGWLMISGYFDDASTSDCSVLVAVDMKTGAYVGEYYLTNADGTPHTSHAGGVAITDKDIYIASSSTLYRIPLTAVLEAGQCGKLQIVDSFTVPVRASFCNYSEGYLWVGDFQYGTSYPTQRYQYMKTRDNLMYCAWTVGYELDPATENGIKASAIVEGSYATPDIILSMTERIQGFAVVGNKIALSQSYGRTNKSTILLYDNPIGTEAHKTFKANNVDVPVYFLDGKQLSKQVTALPMSEGLAAMDGKLYILFESGADKYANGGGLDPTENVWIMNID